MRLWYAAIRRNEEPRGKRILMYGKYVYTEIENIVILKSFSFTLVQLAFVAQRPTPAASSAFFPRQVFAIEDQWLLERHLVIQLVILRRSADRKRDAIEYYTII
ncbi:unnamed protein product [Pieris brassicae]|uniref:Uncharacterized protein n=1 Tax=Pieris brassicae TaxID=7116 RepID=A0A9P0THM6_PIEBR|nr:unnamed protein product [Pieris brassicae]